VESSGDSKVLKDSEVISASSTGVAIVTGSDGS
jgi:hypothetical protein